MITYSAAISACEKAKQPEKVGEFQQEVWQESLEPHVITYSTAISACEKAQQPEKDIALAARLRLLLILRW